MATQDNLNPKQFYHGTAVALPVGGTVDPKQPHHQNHNASYPNSMYFTSHADEAAAYADMAHSRGGPQAERHVYQVSPVGEYTPDMTQRQGGSYRTSAPVRILGEA